jgi:hypothetical protein
MSENKVVSDAAISEAVKTMKTNNQFPDLQRELEKLVNPKPAPAVVAPAPAVENDDNSEINDNEVISYNDGKTSSSYRAIIRMLEETLGQEYMLDDDKNKIRNLMIAVMHSKKPTEVQTLMNEFGTLDQVGEGPTAYYKITDKKGGTRKHRNKRNKLQRKRVKTMKNKKKKKAGKRK